MTFNVRFSAALYSAFRLCPQDVHSNDACVCLFPSLITPQWKHLCDVYLGGTFTNLIPSISALYRIFSCRSKYDHVARKLLRLFIPDKSSICIVPAPRLTAKSTIYRE